MNGTTVSDYKAERVDTVVKNGGYLTLSTSSDYSIFEIFGDASASFSVSEIYLDDSVSYLSSDAQWGFREIYANTYTYPGTISDYKQSCYYEVDALYDRTIACSDGDYHKHEDEGSSSSSSGGNYDDGYDY